MSNIKEKTRTIYNKFRLSSIAKYEFRQETRICRKHKCRHRITVS